jgi:hypothetical protein
MIDLFVKGGFLMYPITTVRLLRQTIAVTAEPIGS